MNRRPSTQAECCATVTLKEGHLTVSGHIDFKNVVSLMAHGIDLINKVRIVRIDLENLIQSDSSGLSLLTGWARVARQQDKPIELAHIPPWMQDLIRISGLESVLPIVPPETNDIL